MFPSDLGTEKVFMNLFPSPDILQLATEEMVCLPIINSAVRYRRHEAYVAAAGWVDNVSHHCLRYLKML